MYRYVGPVYLINYGYTHYDQPLYYLCEHCILYIGEGQQKAKMQSNCLNNQKCIYDIYWHNKLYIKYILKNKSEIIKISFELFLNSQQSCLSYL